MNLDPSFEMVEDKKNAMRWDPRLQLLMQLYGEYN